MDISVKVNIVLCILSFVLSAVSVVTVVITLRQNSKMIESSTRPYVTIYFDYSQMGNPIGYFVIKNSGSSSAIITSLTYNDPIKQHPTLLANLPEIFDGLVGNSIAPGQKYWAPFKFTDYSGNIARFDISYKYGKKVYTEHAEIDVMQYRKLVKPRMADSSYKTISYPLQEIAERLM